MYRHDYSLINWVSKKSKLNSKAFIKSKKSAKGIIGFENIIQFHSAAETVLFDYKLSKESGEEERSG